MKDANGLSVAYVYAAEGGQRLALPYALTRDEARRIARGVARLPELVDAARKTPQDNSRENL